MGVESKAISLRDADGEVNHALLEACVLEGDAECPCGIRLGIRAATGHEGYISPDDARALAAWLLAAADAQEAK